MAPDIHGQNFTVRGVVAGLAIGTVICAANVYFGLQTGWVSIMSMPASLMGFGIFRLLRSHLELPFSPVENVFVQSVACGMAIMPLGCGFVGVIPAMNYLLSPDERGPLNLSLWQLVTWSLGLCYFGVVFAVPLRKQVIIRERLRFPSGFSTAVLISVLHGQGTQSKQALDEASKGGFASLVPKDNEHDMQQDQVNEAAALVDEPITGPRDSHWAANLRLLLLCFIISGLATVLTYFFPILRNIPIFGTAVAQTWLWTLNPSLAYVGQGIIMGTETTMHMTLGAIIGWAILSPLAKHKGWAPGPVDDWESGSKGWIVWISLAIMLVDAVVSLGYVATRSIFVAYYDPSFSGFLDSIRQTWPGRLLFSGSRARYALLQRRADDDDSSDDEGDGSGQSAGQDSEDAPENQRISNKIVVIGLLLSIILCIITIHTVFGDLVPLYATVIAVFMALVLSIMGVRALGETDLNPVSGISKLAQLFFALIIPQSNKSSVLINLVAGAVSEAGALQAGDLMQDLKTGHLLGASPKAQFWGQMIGATAGAILSAFIYRLYTRIYEIPGDLFQVPTAYVWIFTARLVTGQGLPYMAKDWAIAAGAIFACTTILRTIAVGKPWRSWIPGGIAVAVGMYNVPSFTLARAIGGILAWVWLHVMKRSSTPLIILASGFILGEGFLSIANLIMEGLSVPHF
ncbi:oligonucleotide transporter [Cordyceps fumosorosea ARSEF 2679]|uniref:Oligonucleotide transporter n=1 Tax=Cordyceps fumosorosea (strain ARSEF 2679) TaxID=1081104 RepID=A0A167RR95_CORFA|nr:oligonucleotide transporter [Cordyceps fumosorosea ARSEF 2679]OAA58852.1 oligonucleotide transporter [Cordyceps fumosorosea ARSEF 2679]